METKLAGPAPFRVDIENNQASVAKERNSDGSLSATGHFFLDLGITALEETVYIPLSISSGKKPTGFVYQIEGTGDSSIVTTDISLKHAKESGVTQILLGTIAYVEIPKGMTGLFRIAVYIQGEAGNEYSITITHIEYKHDPSDARYQKYVGEIRSGTLKF